GQAAEPQPRPGADALVRGERSFGVKAERLRLEAGRRAAGTHAGEERGAQHRPLRDVQPETRDPATLLAPGVRDSLSGHRDHLSPAWTASVPPDRHPLGPDGA